MCEFCGANGIEVLLLSCCQDLAEFFYEHDRYPTVAEAQEWQAEQEAIDQSFALIHVQITPSTSML